MKPEEASGEFLPPLKSAAAHEGGSKVTGGEAKVAKLANVVFQILLQLVWQHFNYFVMYDLLQTLENTPMYEYVS